MAIATDAQVTSQRQNATDTLTFAHTCTGSDLVLLVQAVSDTSNTTFAATYAGVSMTREGITQTGADAYIATFSLLAPTTGANNVVLTIQVGLARTIWASSQSFTGVSAVAGFTAASGTSTTPSVTVTSASGDLVIGLVSARELRTLTEGTDETELWDWQLAGSNFDFTLWGGSEAGAASVTIAPTISGAAPAWVEHGISLTAVAGGGGSTTPVRVGGPQSVRHVLPAYGERE